jgi:HlyD family secretion protein
MSQAALKPPRRALWLAAIAVVALVAVAAVLALKPFGRPPETVTVERRDLREVIEVSGVVESARTVTLKAETTGTVEALVAAENAEVAKGAPLLRVDATQARLQLAQAQSNADAAIAQAETARVSAQRSLGESGALQNVAVANARNQLAKAQANAGHVARELARNEGLLVEGAVSRQSVESQREQLRQARLDVRLATDALDRALAGADLTATRNALRSAETALTSARAQGRTSVALAQQALAKTTVTAPFAGTLVDWTVAEGDLLAPGTPLGTLQDLADLRLRLPVDELDLPRMRAGGPVAITFDAYPEVPFAGAIAEISRSSVAGAGNVQVFPVKIRFANPDGRIKPGMSADAEVLVRELKQVLTIPVGAARRVGDKTHVTVLRGGKAQTVEVTPGINTIEHLEVKSGLAAGDQVLKTPAAQP